MKKGAFGLRLGDVRVLAFVLVATTLGACRVLTSGLAGSGATGTGPDAVAGPEVTDFAGPDVLQPAVDAGEPPGVPGAPIVVGCSDGTREGFRDAINWPSIAGCAGAFDQAGVMGSPDLRPVCDLQAGDTSANPKGKGCSAADLCAQHWHLCRDSSDVAQHSPTGDCESCVPAGEPRFFLVASGASAMGMCSPDPRAANDLHGCGGLGQPESEACAPLARRMGFADCLATQGVWWCGSDFDSLQEAAVVTKQETTLGGVLCCRD
jgi:hypothetical protein